MLTYLLSPNFQAVNHNGKPLSGGRIKVNLHDPTNDGDQGASVIKYITYGDFNGHKNPYMIPLDVNGMATIIADAANSYDVYCYDSYGNPMWSRLNVKCVSIESVTYEGDKIEVAGTINEIDVTASSSTSGVTTYTASLSSAISDQLDDLADAIEDEASAREDAVAALQSDVAAAKTEIIQGSNVSITSSVGSAGQTIYTVNAHPQQQSDWAITDPSSVQYIKNKPVISDATDIISSDQSVSVSAATSAGVKTYDLSVKYPTAQYYSGNGRISGLQSLSNNDTVMPIDADYYAQGISRSNNRLSLTDGEVYHCTVQICLQRTYAANTMDRLWVSLFGALVYFHADASEMTEQSLEVSIDTKYAVGNDAVKMGADDNGWQAYINVICIHKVAGVGGGSGGGSPIGMYAYNRAMTMMTGCQSANVALPCSNSNDIYYATGHILMPTAPIDLTKGLKITLNYTGGMSDTSHIIGLYKADDPHNSDAMTLVAATEDTHNPGWGGLQTEIMRSTGVEAMLDPQAIYYVMYCLKGYSPMQVAGCEIVQAASRPLMAWQYNTVHSLPTSFNYGNWSYNYTPFIAINANV